jgi:hypothetical protein
MVPFGIELGASSTRPVGRQLGVKTLGEVGRYKDTHEVEIRRYSNARNFLNRAGNWLLANEAQNNLILTIANQLLREVHSYEEPVYLATIEIDSQVSGCAWRTAPLKLGITQLPIESIPMLVDDVANVFNQLPAVLGPETEALEFADLWARQTGVKYSPGMRQGIYGLERVCFPAQLASGWLRRAIMADLPLISEWGASFSRDVGLPGHQPLLNFERAIENGAFYIWQDGESRSMASALGRTPNGIRLGVVYTPPEFRGQGYATALVASLSQLLLDSGHRFCFLYTDLSNPISNKLYMQVGYVSVGEAIDVNFF